MSDDAKKYQAEFDALMAKIEERERERMEKELRDRFERVRQHGLSVRPRVTLPVIQSIFDSGYGLHEVEQIIFDRENPED